MERIVKKIDKNSGVFISIIPQNVKTTGTVHNFVSIR